MAILDYVATPAVAAVSAVQNNGKTRRVQYANGTYQDLPNAEYWVKFGFVNGEGRYISTPTDLALDTMRKGDAGRSQSTVFIGLIQEQNEWHDHLMSLASELESGEEMIIAKMGAMEVRIGRVREKLEVQSADKPKTDLRAITMATKVARPMAVPPQGAQQTGAMPQQLSPEMVQQLMAQLAAQQAAQQAPAQQTETA